MDVISAEDSTALSFALSGIDPTPLSATISSPRLLLVDDEPLMLSSLCALLRNHGYQLETAVSGIEAIDLLNTWQFDLVLLDLCLPDISGHAVMDHIISKSIDTKVIVVSGDTGIEAASSITNP